MSKPKPCVLRIDPDVPPDVKGRRWCLCGAREDHERHTLPTVPEQALVAARYEHEEED